MSDHVDGPRQIGDPPADLTDLFAFTSPENPAHTVLAMNVFSLGGMTAMLLERDQSLDRGTRNDRGRPWQCREIQTW